MAGFVITSPRGINPRRRAAEPGADIFADIAENIDLYGETIRAVKAASFELGGASSEIFFDGNHPTGTWFFGKEQYFSWTIDGNDILFFRDVSEEKWFYTIDGDTAELGITRPIALTVSEIVLDDGSNDPNVTEVASVGTGLQENIEFSYKVVFTYTANGFTIESEDVTVGTTPTVVSGANIANRIDRPVMPANTPAYTGWKTYRSDDGDSFRFVAQGAATGAGLGFSHINDETLTSQRTDVVNMNYAPANDPITYNYVITWVRETGGYRVESGPGPDDPEAITVRKPGVLITRPVTPPDGVDEWKIYRQEVGGPNPTVSQQLVETLDISETDYEDLKPSERLGVAIPTSTTNSQGQPIIFDAPPVFFDGMIGPHYNFVVAWQDSDVYLSAENNPDSWPFLFKFAAAAPIIKIEINGAELVIITEKGIQRGVGTRPTNFYIHQNIIGEGGIVRRASVSTQEGVFYLAETGVLQIVGARTAVITNDRLGEEFFKTINKSSVFMEFNDGKLYLFHDAGILVLDTRIGEYTTRDDIFLDSHRDGGAGKVFVLNDTTIQLIEGSASNKPYIYKTGEMVLSDPERKRFREFQVFATDELEADFFLDGDEILSSISLNDTPQQNSRRVRLPTNTRARSFQVQLKGEAAEITEMKIDVFKRSK